MGCMSSKEEVPDIDPHVFRVANVNDEGIAMWNGELSINHVELVLLRPNRDPTRWPLMTLRRYGFDKDLFTFESGRRSVTGEGIFAFRCHRAQQLFLTLQVYIQNPMNSMYDDLGALEANIRTLSDALNGTASSSPRNQMVNQNLSPSGTIQSNTVRSHSTDSLNGDSIYLEPTPGQRAQAQATRMHSGMRIGSLGSGPLSPDQIAGATPRSPGSPNSIGNHLEMTTLNPVPANPVGCSNVYQEFTPRAMTVSGESNNNVVSGSKPQKKLSLDIPPQELAPSPSFQAVSPNAIVVRSTNTFPSGTLRSQRLGPQSPGPANDFVADNEHAYMNVTPGDQSTLPRSHAAHHPLLDHGAQTTPTSSGTFPSFGAHIRQNSNNTSSDLNRVYENLDTSEMRPLLSRSTRLSKPDLFAKPLDQSGSDKSDPSTPTIHYIVLDLDNTNNGQSSNATSNSPTTHQQSLIGSTSPVKSSLAASANLSMHLNTSTSSNSVGTTSPSSILLPMSPLPPESPKKGVLDYAKIDFNKTVALSNSANPSSELDSEESRKTRHSSVAKPPIAASE